MTGLDLSRLPAPAFIESLDYEALQSAFLARFLAAWAAQIADDPALPQYDVDSLETDPAAIAAQAWMFQRLLDAFGRGVSQTHRRLDIDGIGARGLRRLQGDRRRDRHAQTGRCARGKLER